VSADHQLETARAHLRVGDARGALPLLRDVLPADPRLEEIRRYTELRIGTGDPNGGLEPAALERVLGWLTREELASAEDAIRDQHFTAALRACDAAWRIDHRGAHIALLRATALLRRLRLAVAGKPPPDLSVQHAHLEEAARWIRAASAVDPARHAERDAIAQAIDADLRRVDEELRVEPVKDLVGRFNTILRVYPESPSRMQAANMRSSLAVLAADVERVQRRYAADGPEGRRLSELSITIAGVLVELR
jgi:hypothetical protein